MEKEFGKLGLDEFCQIVKRLPELRGGMKSFPELVRTKKAKIDEILDQDFYWAELYELTFLEQLALFIFAIGRAQKIHEIAQSANPVQAG